MRIVIAGGNGKIALIIERLLSQRGDFVAGLHPQSGTMPVTWKPQAPTLWSWTWRTLRSARWQTHLRGADAMVFAAGAGPSSGRRERDGRP